jgi:uncharacterized BrkB/YihY/UPF0761 family membrane protein
VSDLPAADVPDEPKPGLIQRWRDRLDALRGWATERVEVERGRRPSVRVAYDFYRRDQAFAGSLLAGGLSVKLFLWFLPFSLSVVVLFGALARSTDEPADDIAQRAGLTATLARMVQAAVEESERARLYLGILGIVLLLWAGLGVVRALALTSRLAWRMTSTPPMRKLYGSVAVVGFVLSILGVQWARNRLLGGPLLVDLFVLGIAVVVLAGINVVLLNVLPRPEGIPWTAMIPGALLMTVGILVIRLATIVYFSARIESASDLYGGLGLAGVFLAWLYLISRILVGSISLNATIWQRDQANDETLGTI